MTCVAAGNSLRNLTFSNVSIVDPAILEHFSFSKDIIIGSKELQMTKTVLPQALSLSSNHQEIYNHIPFIPE